MKLDDGRTLADLQLHDGEFLVAVETRKKAGTGGPPLETLASEPSLKLPLAQVGALLDVYVECRQCRASMILSFPRAAMADPGSSHSACNMQEAGTRDAADASARQTMPTGHADARPRSSEAVLDRRAAGGSLAARCVFCMAIASLHRFIECAQSKMPTLSGHVSQPQFPA